MEKSILHAVEVPWQISPSHDFIEFIGEESEVKTKFLINYNAKIREREIKHLCRQYGNEEKIPDEIWNRVGNAIIEINFAQVHFFSKTVSQQEYGLLDSEKFDLSQIAYLDDDLWNETNICPDPSFYEVINSNLKSRLGIDSLSVRHWLILGHDVFFDILAPSFNWEVV
ncbi:hypothetical protein UY416_19500 [Paenibacillus polymyxa]|uniref:hypothetical protein n=1 Tax=Paenibacillus polymyxa TaxID=1406 RepID=UPI002AB480AF|nr:hypothetical protein [Paenibacillus polymyxa]MDY8048480.1 hypothetical protein [Paenibacillus polymyxa]